MFDRYEHDEHESSNSITVSMVHVLKLITWNETGVLFDEHNGKEKL